LNTFLQAQTVYEERPFFELLVADDGRVEALISPNDPNWMTVYRQFIELNRDTGELMIVFNAAKSTYPSMSALLTESLIMGTTISSGGTTWETSYKITETEEGYSQSDMVLWYDKMKKEMVMLYQQSEGTEGQDYNADEQTLWLMRRSSYDGEWSDRVQLLSELDNVHVHFHVMESLDVDDDGYSRKVMVPIHHLSEHISTSNYQMIARTDRTMDPNNVWEITRVNDTEGSGDGMYEASLIRVPADNKQGHQLVAFLRDARGYWIRRSVSQDDGKTWTDPIETTIPNPDQMSQAIYLHSGMVMLIYNPSQSMSTEPKKGDRYSNSHHLAVGLSSDYGLTWQYSRMIEYAYDGVFNYPVGLQDPSCNNIYLTYSVEVDETSGCSMLKECSEETQNTMNYIKFTVITETWVKNDFDYQYDTSDGCVWQLTNNLDTTSTLRQYTFDTELATSDGSITVTTLSVTFGVLVVGNMIWCYYLCVRPRMQLNYAELDRKSKEMKEYGTTQ